MPGFGTEPGKKRQLFRFLEKTQGKAADGQNSVSSVRKKRIVGRAPVRGLPAQKRNRTEVRRLTDVETTGGLFCDGTSACCKTRQQDACGKGWHQSSIS